MKVNLHTHTYRCGHASGEDREYIENAIKNGIEALGFSDHAPFAFPPDGYESPHRVPMALARDYIESLSALREEYKGRIEIKIGFEMEYYPKYFDEMLKTVKAVGAEYVIMGEHYLRNELPEKRNAMSSRYVNEEKDVRDYTDAVCEGIATGVYTYVAHPDMILYDINDPFYASEMRRICEASKKYGTPLEINLQGARLNRQYPNDVFWRIAGEVGCGVVIGTDAHSPSEVYDGVSLRRAMELIEKYKLNYIESPETVNIK